MHTRLFVFLLLLTSQISNALDKGAEILRVCYDNNSSKATIYWKTPPDPCNSFNKFNIYIKEFGNPWQLIYTTTNYSETSLTLTFNDVINGGFKIVTHSACNGIDSFESRVKSIDNSAPAYMELDSVSFDQNSQNIIVGWKQNDSTDNMGYWVYKSNSQGDVNSKILETAVTNAILNGYDKNNPSYITIASFDSCNLFTPISQPQKSAYLGGTIDSCKKEINLTWSKYIGWGNQVNQYLVINSNGTGFKKLKALSATQASEILTNINMGENLCYYVRTEDIKTKKTSSSNTVCFKTRRLVDPVINYLSNVTVTGDSYLTISYMGDLQADTDSLILEKSPNSSGNFKAFLRLKFDRLNPTINLIDRVVDVNSYFYTYRFKTINKCDLITSVSNIGTSIYLRPPVPANNLYNLKWNTYRNWEKGISTQIIEMSDDRFTWNTLKNETPEQTTIVYTSESLKDSICFRIRNIESPNIYNLSSESVSNIKCVYSISDFYFPSAINPFSHNNTFRVFGSGLDKSRAKLEIFNRWGQKIFETDQLEKGWDGKINGEMADMGSYIYKAYFYDQQNKYYLKTGSVFIIR